MKQLANTHEPRLSEVRVNLWSLLWAMVEELDENLEYLGQWPVSEALPPLMPENFSIERYV